MTQFLPTEPVHDWLAERHQIAIIWSVEDVQSVRSDLTVLEAWRVLKECRRMHDCEEGINYTLIALVAEDFYPLQESLFGD